MKLRPGGMWQLHWHTNEDEWQYVINGTIQVCSRPSCILWQVRILVVTGLDLKHVKYRLFCSSSVVQRSTAMTSCCVQAGVFSSGGRYEESTLYAGDAGFAPMSSAHYFKNAGSTDSYVVLIFNAGQLTNIEATALVANMPAEVSCFFTWGCQVCHILSGRIH